MRPAYYQDPLVRLSESTPSRASLRHGGPVSTDCRPSGPRPWTLDWKRKRTHRVRRGRREVRPWPYLPTGLNPLRAVLIGPPKGGFYVRSDNERLRGRDCSATRVARSRPSRRRERQQTQDRSGLNQRADETFSENRQASRQSARPVSAPRTRIIRPSRLRGGTPAVRPPPAKITRVEAARIAYEAAKARCRGGPVLEAPSEA
jgi:hypothetical protein